MISILVFLNDLYDGFFLRLNPMGYGPKFIRKTVWMATGGRTTLSDLLCMELTQEAAFYAVNASGGSRGERFRTMLVNITGTVLMIIHGERSSGDGLVYDRMVKYGYGG